ncbi:Na+/H+ antiporter NhaC [Bacteroidota bacterium]
MNKKDKSTELKFVYHLLPILFLFFLITYGLILRPLVFNLSPFPLEIVFILAAIFSVTELVLLGHRWDEILSSIIKKLSKALPAFLILFSIGLVISSWIISGTIPMLVYYGLKIINPSIIYVVAFFVTIIFSLMTGTSWGSAGSIGIVIMGIAVAMGANLGITAGAIVGGAYFGDKMSPLSDTTNIASIATEVPLFDHINSMMYTTFPSALIASIIYIILGFIYPPKILGADLGLIEPFLNGLESMFDFNILLLIPPVIVLYCSFTRKPIIPTIIVSVFTASVLAIIFQNFTLGNLMESLIRGFNTDMAVWLAPVSGRLEVLLNRGGLYALSEAVIIAFTVFMFIGSLDVIDAMPTVVTRIFRFTKTRSTTILSTLAASALTNSLTSNQYATSFIVGDAFKVKFDMLKIPRKVLSRSIEDTGTMLESVVPWTPTAVFMVTTLGVPFSDYWHWQLLSLINFIVAPMLAISGKGCFYHEVDKSKNSPE